MIEKIDFLKNGPWDFFAVFLAAYSKGWGIIINHKSDSNRNLKLAARKSNCGREARKRRMKDGIVGRGKGERRREGEREEERGKDR